MPIWLLPLLLNIGKGLWHAVCRFWSVFLVGLVILSLVLMVRSHDAKIYNNGYKSGYAQAVKDHPQSVGNIYNNAGFKWLGLDANIWKLHIKLGI